MLFLHVPDEQFPYFENQTRKNNLPRTNERNSYN